MGRATGITSNQFVVLVISIHALRGEGDYLAQQTYKPNEISIHALRGEGDNQISKTMNASTTNFYPRPPWGGRLTDLFTAAHVEIFLSTPSVGRATRKSRSCTGIDSISIHALRGEGDKEPGSLYGPVEYFYPRPPWGGRHPRTEIIIQELNISIHALRGEGDQVVDNLQKSFDISIHALRGEGDVNCQVKCHHLTQFLSTPSVGRATVDRAGGADEQHHFYPRPPWGGRRAALVWTLRVTVISIHALRGEGDLSATPLNTSCSISIHALRGEGDSQQAPPGCCPTYFYPRPPWGGRQQKYTKILCIFCAKGTIISPPGGAIRRPTAKQPLQHSTT